MKDDVYNSICASIYSKENLEHMRTYVQERIAACGLSNVSEETRYQLNNIFAQEFIQGLTEYIKEQTINIGDCI